MKQILSITFFTILAFNLSAQKFYLGVHAGYGFSTSAGQAAGFDVEETTDKIVYERVQGGTGEGSNIGLRFGYNVSKNIGFELGTSYLFGRTLTTTSTASVPNQEFNGTASTTVTMLQLSPEIVFRSTLKGKIVPYAKFGLLLGFNTLSEIDFTINQDMSFSSLITSGRLERKSDFDIGITSSLGANFFIAKQILLFAELNAINLSYQPESMSRTSYIVDGENELSSFPTYENETVYLDRIEYNPNEPIDLNKPKEELSVSVPLSNIRFNLGLRVNF
jgi:hypothetical protein